MRRLVAFTLGALHPSSRMRLSEYRNHLRLLGWDLRVHAFDGGMGGPPPATRLGRAWKTVKAVVRLRTLRRDDPVVVSRELPIRSGPFLKAPNPLVFDIDDALYLGPGRAHIHDLCRRAQVVVCGNATLAGHLASVSRQCFVIPTVVDTDRYRMRLTHDANHSIRIGWLGSSMSVDFTLLPLMETLCAIHRTVEFELVTMLDKPPAFLQGIPWARHIPWSPLAEASLCDTIDIGIMPLQDDPFQAAKCGAKLLQYMAAGLPVIATPVGINRDLVTPGVHGLWAQTPGDWLDAVRHLASDPRSRAAMGQAGRRRVVADFSVARWAPEWSALLNRL